MAGASWVVVSGGRGEMFVLGLAQRAQNISITEYAANHVRDLDFIQGTFSNEAFWALWVLVTCHEPKDPIAPTLVPRVLNGGSRASGVS